MLFIWKRKKGFPNFPRSASFTIDRIFLHLWSVEFLVFMIDGIVYPHDRQNFRILQSTEFLSSWWMEFSIFVIIRIVNSTVNLNHNRWNFLILQSTESLFLWWREFSVPQSMNQAIKSSDRIWRLTNQAIDSLANS